MRLLSPRARAIILPDPALAAIEVHRKAMVAYEAAVDISGRMMDADPAYPAATAVTQRAFDALDDAGVALLEVAPTTLPGLAELLAHIADCSRGIEGVWRLPDQVVERGGRYRRAGDDAEAAEPFAFAVIAVAAETVRRLAAG